jgi:hypothetical protein
MERAMRCRSCASIAKTHQCGRTEGRIQIILSQSAGTDEPVSLPSLRSAVGIARKQGKIDQELRSAEISKKDAEKRLAALITKLAP